jgi:hypothetical protein
MYIKLGYAIHILQQQKRRLLSLLPMCMAVRHKRADGSCEAHH